MYAAASDFADRIDALLPQTQCTRCGYPDCRAYAEAIALGVADVNRCPPGGEPTLETLARLTGRAVRPIDPACGTVGPQQIAVIDELACIGCTLCIQACPVDAIVGAPRRMHAVLPTLCSGCELCVAPCPVDCIAMVPAAGPWTADAATAARMRYEQRKARLSRRERIAQRRADARSTTTRSERKAAVAAALVRARARRAGRAAR